MAFDLLDRIPAEFFEKGVGKDEGHHGFAHDGRRRDGADVTSLDCGEFLEQPLWVKFGILVAAVIFLVNISLTVLAGRKTARAPPN